MRDNLKKPAKSFKGVEVSGDLLIKGAAKFDGQMSIRDLGGKKYYALQKVIEDMQSQISKLELRQVKRCSINIIFSSSDASGKPQDWKIGGGAKEMWVRALPESTNVTEVMAISHEGISFGPDGFPDWYPMVLGPSNNPKGIGIVFRNASERLRSMKYNFQLKFNVVYV